VSDRATRLVAAAMATIALPLAAQADGVLDAHGPVAAANRQILLNALAIMLLIVVPTLVAALVFAVWFRASNKRAKRLPHWVYSGRIELLVWSVPLLAIVFLSGVIWIGAHRLDPFRPLSTVPPVEVQVVSLDWKWLFIYPAERVASLNEVVVPTGVPVHFTLTSASVMNAFFVPQLGSMVATMNGMVTQVHLQADQPGDYFGESTQFSGQGFSDMHFVVRAVPAAEFQRWVAGARGTGTLLDTAAYQALARQGVQGQPAIYAGVAPGLFDAIVQQRVPPAAGVQAGQSVLRAHPAGGG
jgi:cytochrome o ubiquinol oxidase subunit 2